MEPLFSGKREKDPGRQTYQVHTDYKWLSLPWLGNQNSPQPLPSTQETSNVNNVEPEKSHLPGEKM